MNDLNKTFEEGKLQGNALIRPSVYYEDTILEYINEPDWINYIIPVDDATKEYLRAFYLSDSEVLKSNVKKYAIHNGSLLNITENGDIIDFEHQWKVLSDYLLPSMSVFAEEYQSGTLDNATVVSVPTSLEDVLIQLVENDSCKFVALLNVDLASIAVFKSPQITLGHEIPQAPDPVIRAFEEYLPEHIVAINPSVHDTEEFEPALCYAFPTNLQPEEEEKIHGKLRTFTVPDFV